MLDENNPRRVVPRWRSSWITATTPEAKAIRSGFKTDFSSELKIAESEFKQTGSVPVAAELMFLAVQSENHELARSAAESILKKESSISSGSLILSAKRVQLGSSSSLSPGSHNEFIRSSRRLLSRDFNNPILLTDVAHALTAIGKARSAERFIRTALALAPRNRFILRSAVRYYLHVGEHEQAHRLLLKSDLLVGDPWVQASEIAVATVLGKTSKLVKSIDRVLHDAEVLLANQSELGSAIATVHMNVGSDKKAKRLFAKTLLKPNDNSLAQAEWAARKLGLVVTEQALSVPLSFEANSAHSYRSLEIDRAIDQAMEWRIDEPFASRPIGWLAHLHAINDDFAQAAEFYQLALQLEDSPSTGMLLNLNFSRIETGSLDDASIQLHELSRAEDAGDHVPQILANAGALSYASGDFEGGREMYLKAAVAAKNRSAASTEALVWAFFARTSVKYGDPQRDQIVDDASKFPAMSLNPGATHVLRRLVSQTVRDQLERSAIKKVAKQKLQWDAKTNTLTLS